MNIQKSAETIEADKEYRLQDFCDLFGLKETRTKAIIKPLINTGMIILSGKNKDRRYHYHIPSGKQKRNYANRSMQVYLQSDSFLIAIYNRSKNNVCNTIKYILLHFNNNFRRSW